ncbi:hypothetical protein GXP67_33250 [Rhodocytophaga rosea]|uniref:Uncharacterized protein n=1 Tax=Rhodocytophaga rosea TaxID=2704465 RepID=A0A6C0GSQ8_9BACT|nr:hypothetical protein [Rhodocytophaga rosea]QHT71175.1 hypothetical protein GXP67_33250 [Rhodocytophaga rosea]
MNKEAYNAFLLLRSDKNIEFNNIKDSIIDFKEYLETLCSNVCPKGLKDNFIYQWVFTHEVDKPRDYNNYCKANLFAAKSSLKRVISKIETDGMNEVCNEMLTNFICDLRPYIYQFDKNQDYKWLILNTNIHPSNFYNELSKNIFWNGKPGIHGGEKIVLASSAPFIVRQSIEYKIKRILGIDYLLVNNKPDIRTTERCFNTLEKNRRFYRTKDFDFQVIKQIHSWTNYYIHGGYRPEPWRIETAINYLDNLFFSGNTSNDAYITSYAGVEIFEDDLINLRENTEKSLKEGLTGDVKIKWIRVPEVAMIKR